MLQEGPDSPDLDFSIGSITAVREYFGPYAECTANRPVEGMRLLDMTNFYVVRSKVKRMPGGKGVLTVTAEATITSQTQEIPPANETIELDWVREDTPIEAHPHYNSEGACDKKIVRQYLDNANDIERQALWDSLPEVTATAGEGQGNVRDLLTAKLKGLDAYMEFHPVVKRTTDVFKAVTNKTCGKLSMASSLIENLRVPVPLQDGQGGLYVYIKTADRCVRAAKNKRWQRVEEWTGYTQYYPHLYMLENGSWYPSA